MAVAPMCRRLESKNRICARNLKWPSIDSVNEAFAMPRGYRFRYLQEPEIDVLIQHLPDWHPNVRVGAASVLLDRAYYEIVLPSMQTRSGTAYCC